VIVGIGFAACAGGVFWIILRSKHPKRPALPKRIARNNTTRARIEEDSGLWEGTPVFPDAHRRAVLNWPDPRWGTDAALLSECSLLLPEFAPGTDRLLQAIHDDDTTKGDEQ
jgi:hypothetical protein